MRPPYSTGAAAPAMRVFGNLHAHPRRFDSYKLRYLGGVVAGVQAGPEPDLDDRAFQPFTDPATRLPQPLAAHHLVLKSGKDVVLIDAHEHDLAPVGATLPSGRTLTGARYCRLPEGPREAAGRVRLLRRGKRHPRPAHPLLSSPATEGARVAAENPRRDGTPRGEDVSTAP